MKTEKKGIGLSNKSNPRNYIRISARKANQHERAIKEKKNQKKEREKTTKQ